jgi:hypothetical protein
LDGKSAIEKFNLIDPPPNTALSCSVQEAPEEERDAIQQGVRVKGWSR